MTKAELIYNYLRLENNESTNEQYLKLAGFIQSRISRFEKLEDSLSLNFSKAIILTGAGSIKESREEIISLFNFSEDYVKLLEDKLKLLK